MTNKPAPRAKPQQASARADQAADDELGPDEIDMDFTGAEKDIDNTPTADEAQLPEVEVTYGMSGDAGGVMARAGSEVMDQDYSGGGSGMDDESANTTSRSGIGGGAGFSSSRATMGDADGLTSIEAGLADAGGLDADGAETAMRAGSGYAVPNSLEREGAALDELDARYTGADTGTGASDVGSQAAGVTDDDIRSDDASNSQTMQLSNDEALALEKDQAKKKKTGRRRTTKK